MTDDLAAHLTAALDVAVEAGEVALGHFRHLDRLTVERKGVQDLVSEADRETERTIKQRLASLFPDDAFVGEESGADGLADAGRGVWVVDPIDGTQPFLLGLPSWCVSIAYVRDGATQVGVIRNPVTGDTYAARRGGGASVNGRPMHVLEVTALDQGLTGLGCSPRTRPADLGRMAEELLSAGGMYHRTGSGALSLAYVAAGQLIGYVETYINAWDCLAALLLVEEAGGRSCPFLADNGVTGSGRVVAAAPGVYDALDALLTGGSHRA